MALVRCVRAAAAALLLGSAAAGRSAGGSPTWKEAVAQAKEVSALSDRIKTTQGMISQWRRVHDKARRYHEHQSTLIRKQIAIRKRQRQHIQDQLVDYKVQQEDRYKLKMCTLLMQAFHNGGEQTAKVEVLKVCNGLKPFSLSASSSRRMSGPASLLRARLDRVSRVEGAWEGRLSSKLERIVHSLAVVERRLERHLVGEGAQLRGPVHSLRAQLKQLEALLQSVRAQYSQDKAKWATERTELSRVESSLGDEVMTMHTQKQAIASQAAKTAQDFFCPVVKANYHVSEENIVKTVVSECQ